MMEFALTLLFSLFCFSSIWNAIFNFIKFYNKNLDGVECFHNVILFCFYFFFSRNFKIFTGKSRRWKGSIIFYWTNVIGSFMPRDNYFFYWFVFVFSIVPVPIASSKSFWISVLKKTNYLLVEGNVYITIIFTLILT